MNILQGTITKTQTSGSVSIVNIEVQGHSISSIVLETPTTSSYLKIGASVQVLFKETEVVIGIGNFNNISLQNKFHGTITQLDKGEVLSTLAVSTTVGTIHSMITTNSVNQLNLSIATQVMVMVKSNEIMLSK